MHTLRNTNASTLARPARGHAPRLTVVVSGSAPALPTERRRAIDTYRTVLTWAFTFFNSVRVFSYLPTLWTVWQSGDSSQYSLWTWCTWLGANLTMSLWLIDRNGGRIDRAALVNVGNTAMCLAVIVLVAVQRLG